MIRSLIESKEQGKLSSLFQKLLIFVRGIDPARVRSILITIASSVPLFSRADGNLWSEYDNAATLIIWLVDRVAEKERMQDLLFEALEAVDDEHLHFAVKLVFSCDPIGSRLDRIPSYCDIGKLREKVAARLKDFYITRRGDLSSLPGSDWIFILAQWGIYFELGDVKRDIEELIVRKTNESPAFLGELLRRFFPGEGFGEESYRGLADCAIRT